MSHAQEYRWRPSPGACPCRCATIASVTVDPRDDAEPRRPAAWTSGEIVKTAVGLAALALGGFLVWFVVWPWARWTEDFFPGRAPTAALAPQAWDERDDALVFAAVGDTGTGGRNQMDVARAMVEAYRASPYGLVAHVGDVSYYGSILDRWEAVWVEPYGPLLDAGVRFEVALGNHELEERPSGEARAWLQERLDRFGYPQTYRTFRRGPVDFFVLDTSLPKVRGVDASEQLAWLEDGLAASTATWQVVVMHHSPYSSSAKRGSDLAVREAVEPLFVRYGVDLVLSGHDHTYERTLPQQGVTYVITGAGAKLSEVGRSDFTAYSARRLQFLLVDADTETMEVSAIGTSGEVFDRVVLEPNGGRP